MLSLPTAFQISNEGRLAHIPLSGPGELLPAKSVAGVLGIRWGINGLVDVFPGGAVDGSIQRSRDFDVSTFPLGRIAGSFHAWGRCDHYLPGRKEGGVPFGADRRRITGSNDFWREHGKAFDLNKRIDSRCPK